MNPWNWGKLFQAEKAKTNEITKKTQFGKECKGFLNKNVFLDK